MACRCAADRPAKPIGICCCGARARRICRGGAVLRQAPGGAQCPLPVAGCHRVRHRPGHRGSAVCAVFDLPFAVPFCTGDRVSLHGIHRRSACTDLRRRVHASRAPRCRHSDRVMALHLLASWFRRRAACVRRAPGGKTPDAHPGGVGAAGRRLERGGCSCSGARSDMVVHCGRCIFCRPSSSTRAG